MHTTRKIERIHTTINASLMHDYQNKGPTARATYLQDSLWTPVDNKKKKAGHDQGRWKGI